MIRTAFSVVAQVVEAKEEGGPQAGVVLMGILGTTRYLLRALWARGEALPYFRVVEHQGEGEGMM